MARAYNLFPDVCIEGELPIERDVADKIRDGIIEAKDSGNCIDTNFGWLTNKDMPQVDAVTNLQILFGNVFVDEIRRAIPQTKKAEIKIIDPSLFSIKPGHTYPVHVDRTKWYSCVMWLQTTNRGSMCYQENFGLRLHSSPIKIQGATNYIKPKVWKYVCFPSHIPWGMTPNNSAVDTICLHLNCMAIPKD